MYKAITLIEILIVTVILVITLYFSYSAIFMLQARTALNYEVENIQSFFYQIQTRARYSRRNYTLTISQNSNDWCMVAIRKPINSSKEIICDCLNYKQCNLNDEFYIYTQKIKNTRVKNKSIYPNSFLNIDGKSAQLEDKCLSVSLNNEEDILQFKPLGRIYVAPKNKRSNCKT